MQLFEYWAITLIHKYQKETYLIIFSCSTPKLRDALINHHISIICGLYGLSIKNNSEVQTIASVSGLFD